MATSECCSPSTHGDHAILLIGGDQDGAWESSYVEAVTHADDLFDEHLFDNQRRRLTAPKGAAMAKKFKILEHQVMSRPGAKERMAKHRQETLAEYGLYQLRVDAGVSQVELAERLGVTQPAVSKIERADDMRISTLRACVEGLGATFAVDAVLADGSRMPIL